MESVNVTIMSLDEKIRLVKTLMRSSEVRQQEMAKTLGISQPTLSRILNHGEAHTKLDQMVEYLLDNNED